MKKIFLLLCLFLAIGLTARAVSTDATDIHTEYDDLILCPEKHYGEKMLINGTILEIRDDGKSQSLIIIEQTDGPINPVAFHYSRPVGSTLGVKEGWLIAFNGVFTDLRPVRNPWGFYVTMPVFENEEGRTIFSVPPSMGLPEFMLK